MKIKLIICRGCPASGKSTYSKQWVLEDPKKRVRVNRDDIRLMLGKYWVPSREGLVSLMERDMVAMSVFNEYDIILDATNMKSKKSLIQQWGSSGLGIEIEFKDFFDIPLEELIKRDFERTELKVGEEVIRRFYDKQLKIMENEN
jgi:predicted kinase